MNDLQTQVLRSYEQHPRFRFDQPEFELDPSGLNAFDNAYDFARTYHATLGSGYQLECEKRCEQTMLAALDQLSAQTADRFETLFLTELRGECTRLLKEELGHFRRSRCANGLALADPGAQADTLRLTNEQHFFGALRPSVAEEILAIGAPELAEFRTRAKNGRVKREDLSLNTGRKVRHIARILNREFRALGVLDAVSAYMRRRMSVTGLALELSVPQADWWVNSFEGLARAPKTLYAHVDEAISVPKSIVYLSDVAVSNGPTSCYPQAFQRMSLTPLGEIMGRVLGCVGSSANSPLRAYYDKQYHQSMSSERFRRHFMRLPKALRFNSHFGWDVLPDSEAEKSMTDCEEVMLGGPGTFIVFDGAKLVHRGGLVRERDRVALQVVFTDATIADRIVGKIRRTLT